MLHEIALSHATGATCTPSATTTQQSRQQPPHMAARQGRGKGGHQVGAKQKMRRKTVWSVSGQGCKKKVVFFTGFTNGLMTVSRPCTIVVHFDEMVGAEGSHQICTICGLSRPATEQVEFLLVGFCLIMHAGFHKHLPNTTCCLMCSACWTDFMVPCISVKGTGCRNSQSCRA